MKKSSKYILIILIFLIACPTYSADTLSSEDYKVYSAVLRQLNLRNIKVPKIIPPYLVLIHDSTGSDYLYNRNSMTVKKIKKDYGEPAANNIFNEDKQCIIDSNLFKQHYPTAIFCNYIHLVDSLRENLILIEDSLYKRINKNQYLDFDNDYLREFYKLIIKKYNAGISNFSRVGFNKKQNQAIVFYEYATGPLNGAGYMIKLKKSKKSWKIVKVSRTWVS